MSPSTVDFSRALYLGLRHPSRSLADWDRLTTGVPAALREDPAAGRLAAGLAGVLAAPAAVLARSTVHAVLDCVATLTAPGAAVLLDAGAYPIGRWGAAAAGRRVVCFAHRDPDDLGRRLRGWSGPGRPLVVTDGFCPGCGRPAPLAAYLRVVRAHGGLLLVDDTQALGVLGRPAAGQAYGTGGGGTAAWTGTGGPELVVVASLAKGLGVPLAVVAGERRVVGLVRTGPAREHGSPPSAADLAAGGHALAVTARDGDRRRRRLAALVARLRGRLAEQGVRPIGGSFPVQSLPASADAAARVAAGMAAHGIRGVLTRPACRPGAAVTLLVTAAHSEDDVDRAVGAALRCLPATAEAL